MLHSHLRRLERVYNPRPIYFITTNAYHRKPILANRAVVDILVDEWKSAATRHDWYIGQYVVMPDHVHFFCTAGHRADRKSLSQFMKFWKEWTSKRIVRSSTHLPPIWQKEFFDHVVRNESNYAQKKEYVRNNPVKARLVHSPDEWPWMGEICVI